MNKYIEKLINSKTTDEVFNGITTIKNEWEKMGVESQREIEKFDATLSFDKNVTGENGNYEYYKESLESLKNGKLPIFNSHLIQDVLIPKFLESDKKDDGEEEKEVNVETSKNINNKDSTNTDELNNNNKTTE